jgi:HlyD family secretion protein
VWNIVFRSPPDPLQVPTSALFRRGTSWAAFAIEHGKAHIRDVPIGLRGPLQTEIQTGLATGDVVIVHPGASVRDGGAVAHRS